jgi:hypothetical protein
MSPNLKLDGRYDKQKRCAIQALGKSSPLHYIHSQQRSTPSFFVTLGTVASLLRMADLAQSVAAFD